MENILKEERRIFKYWDGKRQAAVDPMATLRKLKSVEGFDLEKDAGLLLKAKTDKDSMLALDRVVKAARLVFGLAEYWNENGEEGGLLDLEVLAIVNQFGEFLSDSKKKG